MVSGGRRRAFARAACLALLHDERCAGKRCSDCRSAGRFPQRHRGTPVTALRQPTDRRRRMSSSRGLRCVGERVHEIDAKIDQGAWIRSCACDSRCAFATCPCILRQDASTIMRGNAQRGSDGARYRTATYSNGCGQALPNTLQTLWRHRVCLRRVKFAHGEAGKCVDDCRGHHGARCTRCGQLHRKSLEALCIEAVSVSSAAGFRALEALSGMRCGEGGG